MDLNPTSYTIGGVKVQCPYKAYPSQVALMAKIISSVQKSQNCLLESPTGSGKTLALLCSSLAWQQAEYVKIRSELNFDDNEKEAIRSSVSEESGSSSSSSCSSCSKCKIVKKEGYEDSAQVLTDDGDGVQQEEKSLLKEEKKSLDIFQGTNDDDDFKSCRNSNRFSKVLLQNTTTTTSNEKQKSSIIGIENKEEEEEEEDENKVESSGTGSGGSTSSSCQCECLKTNANTITTTITANSDPSASAGGPKPSKKRVPKIYYGTRTHKQITQVIRELRKTCYRDVRMCVLASRDNTCIHEIISHDPDKNEICRNLQKLPYSERCSFHTGASKFKGQAMLQSAGLNSAWDIEDLVNFGKRRRACPYYIIRGVKDDAEIIFCPYNYLIDPLVRKSMEISLKGNIVILDEAHNIEDTAREAGSFTLNDCDLAEAVKNLQNIGKMLDEEHTHFYISLSKMMKSLHEWLELQAENLTDRSVNQSSSIMTGTEMIAYLSIIGLGPKDYNAFLYNVEGINDYEVNSENADRVLKLNAATSFILSGLQSIFGILFKEGLPFADDYKVAIISELSTRNFKTAKSNQYVSRHSVSRVTSLNFWCLNPAVPFTSIKDDIRTIILTSGTLAPMDSFQSELGITFASKLETNHVIDKSQVWVGTIGTGPKSVTLQANYQTAETYAFQDEIGLIVLKICSIVPYGVLLFVSSYNLLEKLRLRWQANGSWKEISNFKTILCEPRGSDQSKLRDILYEFYEVVNSSCDVKAPAKRKRSQSFHGEVNGALLMAVCRGKISEGLDFSDNYARAVITLGIPFPNIKDLQVELKRKYNDTYSRSRGLLSGQLWYEIQAFRALNQALGRCIRHRNDWGALVMLDSRISNNPRYVNGLSKWIRNNVCHFGDFDCAMDSLQNFVTNQKDSDIRTPSKILPETLMNTSHEGGDCSENSQDQYKNKLEQFHHVSAKRHLSVSTPVSSEQTGNGDKKGTTFKKRERPPVTRPVQKDYFIDID